MTQTYFAILTAVGEAKLANATALNVPLQITQMGVGDGGGAPTTPTRAQIALVGEKRRAAINRLSIDPDNANQIVVEQVIPENVGGWWIREIGLYDADSNLIAVANCPESYKPQLAEGSGRTQVIRMILVVSSTEAVSLKIDPSVVLATREYCDAQDAKRQPLDATLTALAALMTVADRLIYCTGADTFALTTLSAFIRTLLDDADAATARATLGLGGAAVLGVGTAAGTVAAGNHTHATIYQPLDTDLSAIAALASAANKMIYATGAGAWATTDLSVFARTLLDDTSAQSARATLGIPSAILANEGAIGMVGGTADAITGSYTPGITALTNGMTLYVRAASANATTTPTFTPASGSIAAKAIVKGNGLELKAGDIAGEGHWLELMYDESLGKWVLLNPTFHTGALIGVQIFAAAGSFVYTPTPGTQSIIVEAQGGGGAGGGVPATSTGQNAISGGGSGGAYGKSRFTTGFDGATVTVGAGGIGAVNAKGTNGGATSFGALLSCPGGYGAQAGAAITSSSVQLANGASVAEGPSGANIESRVGGCGGYGLNTTSGTLSGHGGGGGFGQGAPFSGVGTVNSAANYGGAGSGAALAASSASKAGGNGKNGVVIVWEYA